MSTAEPGAMKRAYMGWQEFEHLGNRFLALYQRTATGALGDCEIYDGQLNCLGTFYSLSSFKKMCNREGQ